MAKNRISRVWIIQNPLPLIVILLLAFCSCCQRLVPTKPRGLELRIDGLHCDEISDNWPASKDEVYFRLRVRDSHGSHWERLPSDSGHWDIQKNKSILGEIDSRLLHYTRFLDDTSDWEEITVFLMEEDHGTPEPWLNAMAGILARLGPWGEAGAVLLEIAAQIAKLNDIKNNDDVLGWFDVRVTNANGKMQAAWTDESNPTPVKRTQAEYKFLKDDGSYRGQFYSR